MKALVPGSFDPPTRGHLDIIRRAAALVDALVVGVGANPDKHPLLAIERRVALLEACCTDLSNVQVITYTGSTSACATAEGVDLIIRGLRGGEDWPHESFLADVYRREGFETLFIATDPALAQCRSSHVRQVLAAGLDPTPYVPAPVATVLTALPR
jgi:pantetheine-phosphate adenylyltransferase